MQYSFNLIMQYSFNLIMQIYIQFNPAIFIQFNPAIYIQFNPAIFIQFNHAIFIQFNPAIFIQFNHAIYIQFNPAIFIQSCNIHSILQHSLGNRRWLSAVSRQAKFHPKTEYYKAIYGNIDAGFPAIFLGNHIASIALHLCS